jgi:uncharacterized lipoprotein YmbA
MKCLPRRHLLLTAPALALAGCALAGCASAPTNYYRLAPMPGPAVSLAALSVGVRSIDIPFYLDQNNIARPGGAYQFNTFPNDLWAEPLAAMLQSVMVQNLAARLPNATVIASGGGIEAPSRMLVEINILRFDPTPDGQVLLVAQAAIKTGGTRKLLATKTFRATAAAGQDATSIAAAMSALWGYFASQTAAMITEQS